MANPGADSRREQLLDAAVRTFVNTGYSATRVSDIVREAGVAQGTFYLYFASKSDIFRQVVERFLTIFADKLLSASLDEPGDLRAFRETARARILFTLRTCYENRELARIYYQEAMGADPDLNTRLLEFNRAFAQSLETRLQYGIRRGYLRPHDTRVVSIALGGLVEQVVRHMVCHSDQELDPDSVPIACRLAPALSLADDIVDLELHGIGNRIPNTAIRTNRSCRLAPALGGMKRWKGSDVVCAPQPVAGDKPQRYISPAALGCRCSTVVGVAGRSRNPSRIGVRDMLSYQSPMPIATRTRGYNRWLVEVLEYQCLRPRLPWIPFRRNDELGDRNDGARRGHLDPQASLEQSIFVTRMAQGDAGNVPRLNRFLLPTRFRHYVVGTQRGPVGAGQRSIQSKRWRPGEIGRRRSDSCKTSSDSTQRRCARRDETRY